MTAPENLKSHIATSSLTTAVPVKIEVLVDPG